MTIPSNHRQAERVLVELVRAGEWQIDDTGAIWRASIRTGLKRGGSHVVPVERRRVENATPLGYLMVRAMRNRKRVHGLAHRLVWQWLNGNISDGKVINHINGIKADNRPANLEVVDYSENMSHAHRMRLLDQRGEVNPQAKLSNGEVAAIRAMYHAGGWTYEVLGARFGVAFQTIGDIVKGQSRATQGGPIKTGDLRHSVCDRDPVTQRFVARSGAR